MAVNRIGSKSSGYVTRTRTTVVLSKSVTSFGESIDHVLEYGGENSRQDAKIAKYG